MKLWIGLLEHDSGRTPLSVFAFYRDNMRLKEVGQVYR